MQYQTIEADRDPDLEQARSDMLPFAGQIRDASIRMLEHPEGSPARASYQRDIQDKMGIILARADRIGMSADALMIVLNGDLDAKARRGRPAPSRATSRTLLASNGEIQARLKEAREQEKAWGDRVAQELAALSANEEAIKALGARGLR